MTNNKTNACLKRDETDESIFHFYSMDGDYLFSIHRLQMAKYVQGEFAASDFDIGDTCDCRLEVLL